MTTTAGIQISDKTLTQTNNRMPRVLAMEIETRGHHPSYVRNFAKSWVDYQIPGEIDFLVTRKFFDLHADVVEYVRGLESHGIRIYCFNEAEQERLESIPYLRYFQAWKLFCKYAKELRSDHGLLMYFDFFQLPILTLGSAPCPFSVIYFRPTYHYKYLPNYQESWREKIRSWRKRILIKYFLKVPMLSRVYCLDLVAIDFIKKNFKTKAKIEFLSDSFAIVPSTAQRLESLREELQLLPGRKVFCLLGILDRRKGVRELLEAILTLPEAVAEKISLLIVGKLSENQEEEIIAMVDQVKHQSKAQVILQNQFIPDIEVQKYYDICDVVLTTYQKHMGSSSALIRAALAEKPVLSSDYGLMGEIVRRRRLGLTVDTSKTEEIAKGIAAFVSNGSAGQIDREAAREFAEENSPAKLAEGLRKMVCD